MSSSATPPSGQQNGDLLLLIFIHGFKGTDSSFAEFPQRLEHILTETLPDLKAESIVFPAYEVCAYFHVSSMYLFHSFRPKENWFVDKDTMFRPPLLTMSSRTKQSCASQIGSLRWLWNERWHLALDRAVPKSYSVAIGKYWFNNHDVSLTLRYSMGGLLAADSLREFVNTRPDPSAPLWPRIIACIAFDTPVSIYLYEEYKNSIIFIFQYLGINPFVVKNTVTKVAEYANAATTLGSAIMGSFAGFTAQKAAQPATPTPAPAAQSAWSKWAPAAYAIGGAVLAGAAAGGAYYKKDDLTQGFTWATDHMKYVGNLWDEATLEKRLTDLVEIENVHGVIFRTSVSHLMPGRRNSRMDQVVHHPSTKATDVS